MLRLLTGQMEQPAPVCRKCEGRCDEHQDLQFVDGGLRVSQVEKTKVSVKILENEDSEWIYSH